MPKDFAFKLNKTYYDKLFIVIRDKKTIIKILMNSIKYMLLNPSITDDESYGEMRIYVDKMSRIFFFDKEKIKYYSIVFPFTITKDKEGFHFSFDAIDIIDNKLTSDVINLITCDNYNSICSYEFFDPILEYQSKENEYIWSFLKRLFFMEDGYMRFDYDPESFQKYKEKGEEKKHPLNHYDIFYSNNCSIKIGLNKRIDEKDLINFVNSKEDASFIN